MLKNYYFPVITAVSLFPLIAGLAAIPFLVWNYRKYKGISIMRATVIFSFVFYMMCAKLHRPRIGIGNHIAIKPHKTVTTKGIEFFYHFGITVKFLHIG